MDDDALLRYLLDDLPPADRAAVDRAADPAVAARLARLRAMAAALAAPDPSPPEPPPGLAVAALARTAEVLVASGRFRPPPPDAPPSGPELAAVPSRRWRLAPPESDGGVFGGLLRRADAAVAFGIGLLAVGLGVTAVGKFRHESAVLACRDNLRGVHTALVGYSDLHGGRYPQAGTEAVPTAGAFAAELARGGHLPAAAPLNCPVVPTALPPAAAGGPAVVPVGYAYTLGYRGPGGEVTGLSRTDPGPAGDWTPVAADLPGPATADGTFDPAHRRGLNVLYLTGAVRHAATPAAGVDGDDIYRNAAGHFRAGLHRHDAALGRPHDLP